MKQIRPLLGVIGLLIAGTLAAPARADSVLALKELDILSSHCLASTALPPNGEPVFGQSPLIVDHRALQVDLNAVQGWVPERAHEVGGGVFLSFTRPETKQRLEISVSDQSQALGRTAEEKWQLLSTPANMTVLSNSVDGSAVGERSAFVPGGRLAQFVTQVSGRFITVQLMQPPGMGPCTREEHLQLQVSARYAVARVVRQPGTLAPSQTVRPTRVDRKRAFAEAVVNGRKLKFPLSSNFALDGTKQVPLTGFTTLDGDDWVLPKPRSR